MIQFTQNNDEETSDAEISDTTEEEEIIQHNIVSTIRKLRLPTPPPERVQTPEPIPRTPTPERTPTPAESESSDDPVRPASNRSRVRSPAYIPYWIPIPKSENQVVWKNNDSIPAPLNPVFQFSKAPKPLE